MSLDWQSVAVLLIELAALVYLLRKLVLPAPPRKKGPDVKASALVRKKKP